MTSTTIGAACLGLLGLTAAIIWLTVRAVRGSAERLAARRAMQPFAHELPYWAFVDDAGAGVIVGVDLTYSSLLELHGLDTDCLDNGALNQVTHELHAVLQNLPSGTRLQFQAWSDSDVREQVERYRATARAGSALGRELVDAKAEEILRQGGLRRSHLIVAVSLPAAGVSAALARTGFKKRFPRLDHADHVDHQRRLRMLREQVAQGLEATGVKVRALGADEVRGHVFRFLNPERAQITSVPAADAPAWADEQTAREQLALTGVIEEASRLAIGRRLVRVVSLKSLPTWTEPALLEALQVRLSFHCRLVVAVEALDGGRALDDLKRRRDRARMLGSLRERRNQEAEAQEQDVAELIDKNLRSSVRMVRVAVSVVLEVDAGEPDAEVVLERQTAEVLRELASLHGAQALTYDHGQLDEWLATLPANAGHGRCWRQCTSENAAHLVLAWQSWTGARTPAILLHGGRCCLVGIDPFDDSPELGLDNPNAFMAGASGSGKSSTTNYLLLNLLSTGAGALVIDVGGSYRRLLEIFGGQYFQVGDGRQALNPFFRPEDIVLDDGSLEEQRAQLLAAVIERMVCDHRRQQLGNEERAVVMQALAATYARARGGAPLLEDFVTCLREHRGEPEDVEIARALARGLRVWLDGPFGRLVNRPSTVELTTTVAAFDLKGIDTQPHLRDVVVLILSGIIWNLVMRRRDERKIVVFDEVWKFLATPASAALIAELYRTTRKYNCSVLTISQSVEDFTGSPIAAALIHNSATTYLLKQPKGHEVVVERFGLNAREAFIFKGLKKRQGEYTEALVLHGNRHFMARVVLSPLEYWIATTHPGDLALEQELERRHPRLGRLERLRRLAELAPRGAGAVEAAEEEQVA